MGAVTVKVTDSGGHTASTSVSYIIGSPQQGTAVLGASLDVALPASQVLPAVRVYQHNRFQASVSKGTKDVVYSTKDSTPDATVAELKAAPADVLFYATVNHEPDDDITKSHTMTVAQYVAKLNAFGEALQPLPNVRFGPIHNGWMGRAVWQADEVGADKTLWDFWGMDRYSDKYETPETVFAEGRDYARSLGLPLVIGECGGSPSNATAQQTLAGQIRAWSLDPANNAAVVCWWVGSGYAFANANVQHALLG